MIELNASELLFTTSEKYNLSVGQAAGVHFKMSLGDWLWAVETRLAARVGVSTNPRHFEIAPGTRQIAFYSCVSIIFVEEPNLSIEVQNIISNKFYDEPSVFLPENLLREARRQKNKPDCNVPEICLLDPDGDLAEYLLKKRLSVRNECWACYHSTMYQYNLEGHDLGIIPCIVGSSYAVLVAEQLFASGCKLLISVTSAGIISGLKNKKRYVLITSSIRDEGTSYHYLPAGEPAILNDRIFQALKDCTTEDNCPYFTGTSWTTDAPYRETQSSINVMKKQNVTCVEMEASALYALSKVKDYPIVCFAHLTNSMARNEGDFEKGAEFGSLDTLNLISRILKIFYP